MKLTNSWINVLRATSVVIVEGWFPPTEADSSKGHFKHMASFLMSDLPASRSSVSLYLTPTIRLNTIARCNLQQHHEDSREQEADLDCFELLGKHSSKDGRGRKSGAAGSTVCFCLFFSVFLAGGSKVNVALGPKLLRAGTISFLWTCEARPITSNPGRKVVVGYFTGDEEGWQLLHTADANTACTDAILNKLKTKDKS